MKNLIVSFTLLLATAITPALAHAGEVDPRAERVFAKQFAGAEHVKWTKLDEGYLRVNFVLNGVGAESFFDADGELVGTIRNLFYNQLPLVVMQSVDSKFAGSTIMEVREITNDEGTNYKVTLEQNDKTYTIKLNNLGQITDSQKQKSKK